MKYYIELSDKRNRHLLNLLRLEGKDAHEWIPGANDAPHESVSGAKDAPHESVFVFSPAKRFGTDEAQSLPDGCSVYCGNIGSETVEIFRRKGIVHANFMQDAEFAYKNALLTAEGVLAKVIESTEKSLFDSNILVLGLGRCGKAIALLFKKMGLKCSVVTFDRQKYGECCLYADNYYYGDGFSGDIGKFDVIINTAPAKIIDDGTLKKIDKNAVFIEVASVDCLEKTRAAFRYIPAPALPLAYCSQSAAKIMLEFLKRREAEAAAEKQGG